MNDFEGAIPILNVKDFAASMDYYVNKLGFEKKWDWGEPPTFGCVGRGKVEIFLCAGGQGRPGMWMSIFLKDLSIITTAQRTVDSSLKCNAQAQRSSAKGAK